jgi:hypothetical protein
VSPSTGKLAPLTFLLAVICVLWMPWTIVHVVHTPWPLLAPHIERPGRAREEELV